MDIKRYKVSDVADVIVGFPFKSEFFNTVGNGVRLVRGMNVSEKYLRFGEESRWWSDITDDLQPYYLNENDILIGMDGSKVGKNFALVDKDDLPLLLVQRVACVRAKTNTDQNFLWYCIASDKFVDYVNLIKTGSSIPHISGGQIKNFPVFLPPLSDQKKIAHVLSALDRKIALNKKINQTLEAMAKQLYDYWFVQFDFPNAEGKPYKSSGGKMVWNETLKREIPEGWEAKKIADFCNTYSGGTPKSTVSEYYDNGDIPWINSGELNNSFITSTSNYITRLGFDNSSAKIYPTNTILVAMYGATAGKVGLLAFEACSNQAICGIVARNKDMVYILKPYLDSLYRYFVSLSSGSARDNISQDLIRNLYMAVPQDSIVSSFAQANLNIYEQVICNQRENQLLTTQRDELLPLLMNGQVSIK